jgi:hypothetical protein
MNGIEEQPDFNSIGKIADSIYKPFLAEQGMLNQPNIRMNADGQYVQVAQRDSPQMEWLKKMGLPDPRASYDVKYALENDPSLVGMLGQVAATQGDRDLMRKEFEDRLKRMKKYREDDIKDARTMDKYRGATQQALSEYFGAASRGQALRPEMPEGVNQWRAPSPNVLATQQANQRISPTGMDLARQQATINSRLPGMSPGARADMRDPNQPYHPAAAMDMLLGPPRPRQPEQPGQPPVNNLPSYINGSSAWTGEAQPTAGPNPGAFSQAGDIVRDAVMGAANPNDVELSLPGKPRTSEMINGIRPEGYSMLDLVRQQPFRDMANYQKQRTVDQAISPQAAAQIYMKKERDIDKRQSSAAFKYLMGLAPTIVAGRQGRSPRTDAIQQRLAPLYQIGALGQR